MAEILNLCRQPKNKTQVMYKTSLTWSGSNYYLSVLQSCRLLDVHRSRAKYETTQKGLHFVEKWKELTELLSPYQITIKCDFNEIAEELLKNRNNQSMKVSTVVGITEISAIIAATAVVVAAMNVIMQNRKAEKARQTHLMMQLFSPLRDFEFIRQWVDILNTWEWKDYDDFAEKYFRNPNEYAKFIHVTSFYNTVGLLLKMKIIDLETVSRWHPEATIWLWEKIGPMIKEGEKRMIESGRWHMEHRPEEWFEYLYNEMKKRE